MTKTIIPFLFSCTILFIVPVTTTARGTAVTGGPKGVHPYLFKGVSEKNLIETARDHQWSLQFHGNRPDTLHIIAMRIEFAKDTSVQTTGNGLFGIRLGGDKDEIALYENDTTYIYDDLPHDSLYFARQLDGVKNYFAKVSRGNLVIDYSIYPSGKGQTGFAVDTILPFYSPGGKKRKETWDDYYERKTLGLITFVRDALKAADGDQNSPFAGLTFDSSNGTIRNEKGQKTVFLIVHAGSSYLTDGGEQGALGQDSPSDMIDAFITREFFKYYRDTLELGQNGVYVSGKDGSQLLIDEVMMCSETSNQDGLNWGIQGILVNQVARQLGIPDLFSTYSGISGIGAFCIMDFAGYSATKGFIPPYPSAWVRAFMGWDRVFTVPIGTNNTGSVKALTSVLDRDTSETFPDASDTTILLVPINGHEYYLIENRQRNLDGDHRIFNHDTIETIDEDTVIVISNYPYVANIDSLDKYDYIVTTGKKASNVIQRVANNDIGLPASGLLVWHVDEKIIRDHLSYNAVNADSTYRGVSLVEADGITDLGVEFTVFYQATFDYGGSEDVFPHRTAVDGVDTTISIYGFGPQTRPSTQANDGGHSWLELSFRHSSSKPKIEKSALGKNDGTHFVTNFSDSLFQVEARWNYLAPAWPRRAVPGTYFSPLLADVDKSSEEREFFLLDRAGRVYLWNTDTTDIQRYNTVTTTADRINLLGDTLSGVDTMGYFDSIPGAFTMPSTVAGLVAVPSSAGKVHFYRDVNDSGGPDRTTLQLSAAPSTYLCNFHDSSWAIGCENGTVMFGAMADTVRSVSLPTGKPVSALAALREMPWSVAAVQIDGTVTILTDDSDGDDFVTSTLTDEAIAPFSIVTGDLDRDSSSEIIITDSRQGMWVFTSDLSPAHGWTDNPNDYPAYYRPDTTDNRKRFPENASPPALADIDRDGYLDILIGGTNGIYALNYKGALKDKWPAFLDRKFWFQRGSVTSSPIVVTGNNREPLVLFSSVTGENATYRFTKITKADKKKGTVWFRDESGRLDSLWDLTAAEIDTIIDLSDSIIAPYTLPGGILDVVNAKAKRPRAITGGYLQSEWPLTTGASLNTSPLIGFMDDNDTPDLFAVSTEGWIYRWELAKSILPDSLFWPQTGYDNGRSFAFGGKTPPRLVTDEEPITFFSFPNPTRGLKTISFKYKFGGPASNVRLDIFSYTGFRVYSRTTMGLPPRNLTGSYPDWNIHNVKVDGLGPGVYRCRFEATVNGKKHHRYWKMAVVK